MIQVIVMSPDGTETWCEAERWTSDASAVILYEGRPLSVRLKDQFSARPLDFRTPAPQFVMFVGPGWSAWEVPK